MSEAIAFVLENLRLVKCSEIRIRDGKFSEGSDWSKSSDADVSVVSALSRRSIYCPLATLVPFLRLPYATNAQLYPRISRHGVVRFSIRERIRNALYPTVASVVPRVVLGLPFT